MKTEKEKILSLLQRTYEKGAWHGPSVKEVLEKVSAESVFNKLPNTHSIIELVMHMSTWRIFVTKKLEGDDAYKVSDEQNFRSDANWTKAVHELEESQQSLISAISNFPEEKLSSLVPQVSDKYTYYTLIHGVIHHDLYHAGQIMLINKATSAQSLQTHE